MYIDIMWLLVACNRLWGWFFVSSAKCGWSENCFINFKKSKFTTSLSTAFEGCFMWNRPEVRLSGSCSCSVSVSKLGTSGQILDFDSSHWSQYFPSKILILKLFSSGCGKWDFRRDFALKWFSQLLTSSFEVKKRRKHVVWAEFFDRSNFNC
jgi:hypothetical protein